MRATRFFCYLSLLGVLAVIPTYGGNLQPPGPPAPTMKTLAEIEPGVPIHASDLPLTIQSPGVYYLAEEITYTGAGIPILIQADGVTFDLRGFTLASTSTTSDVISIAGPCDLLGVSVANGRLRGGRDGIRAAPPSPCRLSFEGLAIVAPAETGILVLGAGPTRIHNGSVRDAGENSIVVTATGNPPPVTVTGMHLDGQAGVIIISGATARVAQNVLFPPSPCLIALELINADGSRVTDNSILYPPNPCLPAVQIVASIGVVLQGNTIRAGGGMDPAGHGIQIDPGSHDAVLQQNLVSGFGGDGIRLEATGCVARGNLVNRNGGRGLFVAGDDHLLEGNRATMNGDVGSWFDNSSGHVYRDNVLTGNTAGSIGGPGSPDVTDAGGNVL